MLKLFLFVALIAFSAADVSHLFKGNKPKHLPAPPRKVVSVPPRRVLPVAPASTKSQQEGGILKSESDINPDGSYNYLYETQNGIFAQEQGQQKQVGQDSVNSVQGSFQYSSPEGVPIVVQYIADENGFQPSSDILPTPPPIPAAILRALEWIAAHPAQEVKKSAQSNRFSF